MRIGGRGTDTGVVIASTASFCLAFSRGSSCSSHCLRFQGKKKTYQGEECAILSNRFIFLLCTKDRCNAKIRNGLRHMGLTVFNDIYALLLLINDLKKKSKVARSKKKSSCDNKELQVSTCS